MNKQLSKLIIGIALVSLSSCGNGEPVSQDSAPISALRGSFTSSEAIHTKIKHSVTDGEFLYAWKYPEFLLSEDQNVLYRIDQRLQLKRDYTYSWNYTIILGNPDDWGNLEIAKIAVDIGGTFTYRALGDSSYAVTLSNPLSGNEMIYGCNINNFSWFGGWTMHAQPDFDNDYSHLSKTGYASFSKYVCSRTVNVEVQQDGTKTLSSYLFYRDCLHDIARYSTY